jgi:hypothetical protein
MKAHVEAAIKQAALIAARSGVASAPLHRSDEILWQRFDGDIFKYEMAVPVMLPQCMNSIHLLPREPGELMGCWAFPDEIPSAILKNLHNHRDCYPGDNGIRFEPSSKGKTAKTKVK